MNARQQRAADFRDREHDWARGRILGTLLGLAGAFLGLAWLMGAMG